MKKKYIDADLLRKEIEFAKSVYDNPKRVVYGIADDYRLDGKVAMCNEILRKLDSLQQEQPEPYFYCKYGGIMPLCSDCKRNHSNSSFKTEEITTWYTPSCGSKQCIDYIQREQKSIAERFAKIVRENLIGIDKEVQQKFERLYFEVTGNKMYGGYND